MTPGSHDRGTLGRSGTRYGTLAGRSETGDLHRAVPGSTDCRDSFQQFVTCWTLPSAPIPQTITMLFTGLGGVRSPRSDPGGSESVPRKPAVRYPAPRSETVPLAQSGPRSATGQHGPRTSGTASRAPGIMDRAISPGITMDDAGSRQNRRSPRVVQDVRSPGRSSFDGCHRQVCSGPDR